MSTLTFTQQWLPSASLGKLNPLPDIRAHEAADQHARIAVDAASVSPEESKYMGWGRVNGILPYLMQDGYDRKKKPRAWRVAVLENAHIKATFFPTLGGRLWSLIDKVTGRELLHCNPVFQPCNLALRNAWISGGVEWNAGIIGHTPFTVDRLFVEALSLADGTPVLRMYQYERVRGLLFRVEAMLPKDSKCLLVRVRLDNTSDQDTATYWWSNMAVDEREDVRVIVPAAKAFRYGYGGKLAKVDIPYMTVEADKLRGDAAKLAASRGGTLDWDISRTTGLPQAMDFFFDLPEGQRRWISALGGDGYGLVQTSTDVLKGRKLFVWGMGAGGRNWQQFLSQPGQAYLEIQAGLAHTQLEHLPMRGGEVISWLEAYGPLSVDPAASHGADWARATDAVERALAATLPRPRLDVLHETICEQLDGRVGQRVACGAGWARVEQALRGDAFKDGGLRFTDACVGARERPWLELARQGRLPCIEPLQEPTSYQIGAAWEALLARSIEAGASDHWYGLYQLGVMRAHDGRVAEARAAFERSLAHSENPWALRCLAALAALEGREDEAASYMLRAVSLKPERNIAKEALTALNRAGQYAETVRVCAALPAPVRALGRIKVLLVEALIALGDYARAERMLRGRIELTDVREGEVSLTDLWFRLCAGKRARDAGTEVSETLLAAVRVECPPPAHLDFRMH